MRKIMPAIFAEYPHESRSDRYVYLSSADALQHLGENGFMPVECRVSGCRDEDRRNFVKHAVRLRPAGDLTPKHVGGTCFEVVMRNAHDGTASWQFSAGVFRFICLNGAVVSDHTVADVRVRHQGDRQRQLDAVVEGAMEVLDQAPKVMEKVTEWQQIELRPDEQRIYAEEAHKLRFGDAEGRVETAIEPAQLLHARRPADAGPTLWQTFQRVQENAIRGGLSAISTDPRTRRTRHFSTRAIQSIDGDIKLNRALWALTEKMAALKDSN
jgi:hypothetical protein